MSTSRRTTLFVITIALGVISGVAFILSLPDSWQKLREASAAAPLPDSQVGNIAIGLLVMALLMLAVGIAIAYREINREQDPAGEDRPGGEPEQAAAIKLLQDQGFLVRDLRQKPPRKWVIGGSVLMMAIAISMIPMAHKEVEEDPGHSSIAVADNQAVGGQSRSGKNDSKKQAQPHQVDSADPGAGEEASTVSSEGAASPVAEKSSSGSTCVCPSPVSSSGGGSSEFVPAAPEPEEFETEEPEEFEFEEPEEFEPSEAEFEEFE